MSQKTKKGTLALHNLLALAKGASINQDYASQIIHLEDYSDAKQISQEDLLDIFQTFDLFDIDGSTVIKKDLLTEYETRLKEEFTPEENDVYKVILDVSSSQVQFNQFVSLFQNNHIPLNTLSTVSKKFSNNNTFDLETYLIDICWTSQNQIKPTRIPSLFVMVFFLLILITKIG
ncbi:MAG: hypothetical protein EOO43_14475 [Flavobacterium sp.]|nr:MAG: hypothetical protein EOO43_14475 [Flavobacterium sp.]